MEKFISDAAFLFSLRDLDISSDHIEAAMGYSTGDATNYRNVITTLLHDAALYLDISGYYRIIREFTVGENTITIENHTLSTQLYIAKQLQGAEAIAIYVCTAGDRIKQYADELMFRGDWLEGYIIDTIGSEVVEKAARKILQQLGNVVRLDGFSLSTTFCPGYCDWEMSDQKLLFQLLPQTYSSVKLTESYLMNPIKSVNGIVGIGREMEKINNKCQLCNNLTCFRRDKQIS